MAKVLMLFLFLFSFLSASPITSIDDIKEAYRDINSRQASLATAQKEIEDISSEGAVARYFFESDDSIALIQLNIYGETGRVEEAYYFQNSTLFFVYSIDYRYNAPLTSGGYNPGKTQIRKNRYYFLRGTMVKWLDNTLRNIPKISFQFKNKSKDVVRFTKKYLLANVPKVPSQNRLQSLTLKDGSKVALYYAEEEGRVTVTVKQFVNGTITWQKVVAQALPGAVEVGGLIGLGESVIVAGHTTISGTGKSYFWLTRLGIDSQTLWQKKIEAYPQDTITNVLKLTKGFFETVTIEDEAGHSQYVITVYKNTGETVWKKAFANTD
ncbi:hypothetical protein [Sulfurovum sp. NBC37-1]|uniref:hypothetical protein n=1 Tax=Sulfurovum sp. (strain NBC37-1) TaxID=387093 RepID=UPI00015874CC|nr:hypothetical protein [Sulfurovum sp. NBC37-1]BAF71772.1 hypothetical protein SUN_0814 [Sulfurovum sp. NBC37-1]